MSSPKDSSFADLTPANINKIAPLSDSAAVWDQMLARCSAHAPENLSTMISLPIVEFYDGIKIMLDARSSSSFVN